MPWVAELRQHELKLANLKWQTLWLVRWLWKGLWSHGERSEHGADSSSPLWV
jgi:hypothetical protein